MDKFEGTQAVGTPGETQEPVLSNWERIVRVMAKIGGAFKETWPMVLPFGSLNKAPSWLIDDMGLPDVAKGISAPSTTDATNRTELL